MADPYQLKPIPPDQLRNESRVGVYSAIAVVVLVVVLAVGVFFATRARSAEPQPTWRAFPFVIPTVSDTFKRGRVVMNCIDRWMWENKIGEYSYVDLSTGRDVCKPVWDRLAACQHEEKMRWAEEVGLQWNMFNIWVEGMNTMFEYAIDSPSLLDDPGWRISIFQALDGVEEIAARIHLIDAPSVVADAHDSIELAVAAVAQRDAAIRETISESDVTRLKEIGDTMFNQSLAHLTAADASLEAWSHRCE